MPPPANQHEEIEAGEIDVDSRSYTRKRDVDELYNNGHRRSYRDTEDDDPFAEYERLSRSTKRRDSSDYEEKRHRSSYYSASGRSRHSREYESNNRDKRDKNPYVSNRGDNNNHRRSRSPINRNRNRDLPSTETTVNKYSTTVATEQEER
jgi:hypothetical protein